MKKLLSILLLCFCFSATAQNSSTIQQLLDEGVTIGELLDAGVTPEEFYGIEHGGGYIYNIDTISNLCKVVNKPLSNYGQFDRWMYTNSVNEEIPNLNEDGQSNTEVLLNYFSEGELAFSFVFWASVTILDGYSDWYLPSTSECIDIGNNIYKPFLNPDLISSYFSCVTSNQASSDYSACEIVREYGLDVINREMNNDVNGIVPDGLIYISRSFNYESETLVSLKNEIVNSLNQGVTIGELLDAGVTPEEFYGIEHGGGYIYNIDTISNLCKVVNKPLSNYGQFDRWMYTNSVNEEIPNLNEDGQSNTEVLLNYFSEGELAFSFVFWASVTILDGYSDWYLPSTSECIDIGNNIYKPFLNPDLISSYFSCVTSNQASSDYSACEIVREYGLDVINREMNNDVNGIVPDGLIYISRSFNYESETLVSPALQSFLETYTPPVVEEEVVSDANSFDVLNPLSYNGEFEVIQHDFVNGEYIVPNGKTLLIKTIHSKGDYETKIEIDGAELTHVYNEANTDFVNDIVVGSNKSINSLNPSWETPGSNSNTTFTGVLINKTIETIHHAFTGQVFTVPPGKTLVINQILLGGNSLDQELYLNNLPLFKLTGYGYGNNKKNNLFVGENQTIGSEYNTNFSFHGYLINNSNYTYATDYELIEALNEGMDSLSAMSQMVVLENDSISSQNAILSQENEALMAIDYNFDSLQYVADYLSTQVFDLQQELLVPNIEVDMAIGWNMIGFSCPEEKELTDALNEIVDEVLIMKNNNGSVFMPEFSFNGIGDLTPGHGYQIKVADYILDFNICE